MNLRKTLETAMVVSSLTLGASACDDGPLQQDCDRLSSAARPAGEACLDKRYAKLDDLRSVCRNGVVVAVPKVVSHGSDIYPAESVPAWECLTAEPFFPSGSIPTPIDTPLGGPVK